MSVSQSSTWQFEAERAIDGDMNTISFTNWAWDTDLWYKMEFGAVYCFPEIVIAQSHLDWHAYRMNDLKVLLRDSSTGIEHFCETLRVRQVWTIAGQTQSIPCDACGNLVKLVVRHNQRDYPKSDDPKQTHPGCIHMREITAIQTGSSLVR